MDMPVSQATVEPQDPRRSARSMYWQGYSIAHISRELGVPAATIASWKRRDKWDATCPIDRVEDAIEARLMRLLVKDTKTGGDFKEIDLLARQLERTARVKKYSAGGNEADLNPKVANRNKGPRKVPEKNPISDEQQALLVKTFHAELFDFQRVWHKAGLAHRIRNLLKSRQIGATWYFAREAFIDALETGRNQIFLSASKAQAHVFKQCIRQFAKTADVELKGDPIVLPNGAELYFLGTNISTAQSYHGNLYMDEIFWIPKFRDFRKVASGMALHKRWRQTYFSTPSTLTHQAFDFWSGALFNKGRTKADRVEIDTTHKALAGGLLCADGQWRQIVTIMDAIAGGCNLFDIEQLRLEYGPAEFDNLLMCQFIDDSLSVFSFDTMQRCLVDSWTVWDDYKPFAMRPLGHRQVWVGYDPSHTGDSAALVVIAPPAVPGGKFRLIERFQFKGMDFAAQAEAIRKITERYDVAYIGIDTTGIGQGVFQLVKAFYPSVRGFNYSPQVKTMLVLKALDVVSKGRFELDAGCNDVVAAFLAIKKTTTPSGTQITFEAGRSAETSHADLAWACMHAMANEPLEGQTAGNTGFMEIS